MLGRTGAVGAVLGKRGSTKVVTACVLLSTFAVAMGWSANAATAKSTGAATGVPLVSAKGTCGTLPAVAPNDPDHVVSRLGRTYRDDYVGFTDYPIVKSPWSAWKPKRKSGWNVQIVWSSLDVPFNVATLN